MTMATMMHIGIDEIMVGEARRPVNEDAVKKLSKSIREIGLQHPITVKSVDGKFLLVAGRHRMEACRRNGEDTIPATIVRMDKIDAEMWEISENLHRADLTVLERDTQVARWIELTKLRQADAVSGGRGNEGGVRAASRDLGISEPDARRSVNVASLSDEAKEAAVEVGLDDNRTALLAASRAEPDQQAGIIRDYAEKKGTDRNRVEGDVKARAAREVAEMLAEHVPGEWWDALKANLYAAGAANIAHELTNITGQSLMDRRYGS